MNFRALSTIFALLLTAPPAPVRAQDARTVVVAAAADLQTAFPALASAFQRATGIRAVVSYGSSGNFFAQIQHGAPFDIFFSADADYPRRLAAAGRADPGSVYEYGSGRLVLWTRRDSGLDPTKGLPVLRDARVRRVAIANPAVAPYGRAAMAALTSAHLIPGIERKLVYAENVSQAAQLAESGNAEMAVIGHALALGAALQKAGRFAEIPARMHPPITQALAIVSGSRRQANAEALAAFVKSEAGRQILAAAGFDLPALTR